MTEMDSKMDIIEDFKWDDFLNLPLGFTGVSSALYLADLSSFLQADVDDDAVEPGSGADTPHSTESEQSALLVPSPREEVDVGLLDAATYSSWLADPSLASEMPEMMAPPAYDTSSALDFGQINQTSLGLFAFLDVPQPTVSPATLTMAPPSAPSTNPPSPSKRSASEAELESSEAPRKRRGRPPKTFSASSISPVSIAASLTEVPPPSAKSTDRPKSVIPQKYLKDGLAERTLGLTEAEINSCPTFEALLTLVPAANQAEALKLQKKIDIERSKAAEAARKGKMVKKAETAYERARREEAEKKLEVVQTEKQSLRKENEELRAELAALRSVLSGLLNVPT